MFAYRSTRHLVPILTAAGLATPPLAAQCGPQPCKTHVIVVPRVWEEKKSPYCVDRNITLNNVTIQPGVIVQVMGNYSITFGSNVTVAGTAAQPVTFQPGASTSAWGGLVLNNSSSVTLRHCVFRGGTQGVMRITDSAPTIEDCTFTANRSQTEGGALVVRITGATTVTLTRCTFNSNESVTHAGAIRASTGSSGKLVLRGCRILANKSNPARSVRSPVGGGMYVDGDAELYDCVVRGNQVYGYTNRNGGISFSSSSAYGGGIFFRGTLSLERTIVEGNLAHATVSGCVRCIPYSYGGGISTDSGGKSLTLQNSVISGNEAAGTSRSYGGGIYLHAGNLTADHVTIARNKLPTGSDFGPGIYVRTTNSQVTVTNSILFHNRTNVPGHQQVIGGTTTIDYSCYQGVWTGSGKNNNALNPGFLGNTGRVGDLMVASTSPTIDSATPSSAVECLPPGQGTTKPDMGWTGGPLNCALHTRAQPLTLAITPDCVCREDWIELRASGAFPGLPAGFTITAVGGVPLPPPGFMPNQFIAYYVAANREWSLDQLIPTTALPRTSITLRAVALTPGLSLVFSPPQTLRIK